MTVGAAFTIACVCTGNICRSPAAERLLARALGPSVAVFSAGTHALVGRPISPPMDRLVQENGADAHGFVAQLMTDRLLRSADLVLGMTREHRAALVKLTPAVVRRAFTLREYARLLTELDPDLLPDGPPAERARASLPLVIARRRQVDASEDDVPDPYRREAEAYELAFGQIGLAVAQIAAYLAPEVTQPLGWSAT